jgi:7-carboxy-7-deazaguanine synthase
MYCSLQGEGALVGLPSVLVRFAGCPFRCRWCDTAYAWDYADGTDLTPGRIVEQVCRWSPRFTILTGGEPMMGPDRLVRPGLTDLTHHLRAAGKHVTIETAGALFVPELACDLMSISPKLTNSVGMSHQACEVDIEALNSLVNTYPYQLKFVVDSPEDLREVRGIIDRLEGVKTDRVMLMPQARTRAEFLRKGPMVGDLCKQTGFRFSDRLHILLWDNQRGR